MRSLVVLVLVVACGDSSSTGALRLESSTPAYGPVVGGTLIKLTGSGFSPVATENRVFIAGREALLVATVDESTLGVVIPPGDQPGDAEVVVLSGDRNVAATGVFHYSTPPAIASVAPADVLFSSGTTVVTVSGTGFLDEDAGDVTVVVDGQPATEVHVTSDTSLTFVAPLGRPLVRADIELVDRRGDAVEPRAFRYTPSVRSGLLLFAAFGSFAYFFDPVDNSTVSISGSSSLRFTAVVRDEHGDYWGLDRSLRFGRIDMKTLGIEAPIQTQGTFPAMIRVGGEDFALERGSRRFGKLDPVSGAFTPVGDATLPCCGSYGLASNDTTMYFVATAAINTIDPVTGVVGTPVPITAPPSFHVEDMRFFGGKLYAASRDGTLCTIDPTTGAITVLPVSLGRFTAIEVFE